MILLWNYLLVWWCLSHNLPCSKKIITFANCSILAGITLSPFFCLWWHKWRLNVTAESFLTNWTSSWKKEPTNCGWNFKILKKNYLPFHYSKNTLFLLHLLIVCYSKRLYLYSIRALCHTFGSKIIIALTCLWWRWDRGTVNILLDFY